jgi:DNA-binding protein H-NS
VAGDTHAVNQEGQDEAFTHAARTLIDFTTLPEVSLRRVVRAALRELSVEGLLQVEEQARALRETPQAEEVERARATLAVLAQQSGQSVADLFPDLVPARGRPKTAKPGAKLPVKYRGPTGEEWSGRGQDPTWLKTLEAQGHNRSEYEVQQDGERPASPA